MRLEAEVKIKVRVIIEIELPADHGVIIKAYRREVAKAVLESMEGNRKKAMKILGLSRIQLWRWLRA